LTGTYNFSFYLQIDRLPEGTYFLPDLAILVVPKVEQHLNSPLKIYTS